MFFKKYCVFSNIFGDTYALIIKYWLFLSFLTFLFATFNNSPYSTYVNNFLYVSYDGLWPFQGICDKQVFTKFVTILTNCAAGVTVAVDK